MRSSRWLVFVPTPTNASRFLWNTQSDYAFCFSRWRACYRTSDEVCARKRAGRLCCACLNGNCAILCLWSLNLYETIIFGPPHLCCTKMSGDGTFTPWRTGSRKMPWQTCLDGKTRGHQEKSPFKKKSLFIIYKTCVFLVVIFFWCHFCFSRQIHHSSIRTWCVDVVVAFCIN